MTDAKTKYKPSVIERFMMPNPQWQEGYKAFNQVFGKPLGWLFVLGEDGGSHLIRLDRKSHCDFYNASVANQKRYEEFLLKYGDITLHDDDACSQLPNFFRSAFGKDGIIFSIRHLGRIRGLLFLCSLTLPRKQARELIAPFDYFLSSQVELAYKTFELNNFYETVHPRALALSTMHSVHRVISSSLRLNELLPRIGRLSAQVLKAQGCSILLCDAEHEYLLPFFTFGKNSKFVHRQRIRIGRGLIGRMAKTGDFHVHRRSIGVPFIDEDVVGVIFLWDKIGNQPFSKTDLEILKSLSEQAVVAIKNAQLFEETEKLTIGTIKTINELLDLTIGGERGHLPVFAKIVIEIGKDLQLSGYELTALERALMLLNTGALAFPEQVWRKKGKLTKKEFMTIKRIPMRGASLLQSISSLKPVIPIVRHHRESFDGTGYPDGLKNEEIPVGARIVSVVDSFLAMISKRSYRETKSIEAAIREIQSHSGTQFDPHVVDSFFKVIHQKNIMVELEQLQAAARAQ